MCIISFPDIAQISPGDLSRAHSHLEGMSNCAKCHGIGEQLKNSNCLECHSEIKNLLSQNRGYHSTKSVKLKNCWECHGEHFGRDFKLINFDKNKFNHSAMGFVLDGKHSQIKCEDCHNKKFITYAKLQKKNKTFLGLDQNCSSCHEDVHKNTLGENCKQCHNTEKFIPAVAFNHNTAKFKLTGQHTKVLCNKCHFIERKNGVKFQKFVGLNFINCTPCHRDEHKGKFGADCKKCHVVSGFQFIDKKYFNHDQTNFALTGAHQNVECKNCHKNSISDKPLFDKCFRCHQDYHKGEFTSNSERKDCSACHNNLKFTPSLFSADEHNKTGFQLAGSHLAVSCRNCHFRNSNWSFQIKHSLCTDCHENVHSGELITSAKNYKCEDCHNISSWKDINFSHQITGYELLGKHRVTGCKSCHYVKQHENKMVYQFVSTDKKCESCHKDIHLGQFADAGEESCKKCHSFDYWKPSHFDHNSTRFPLTGGHSNIDCNKCHVKIERDGISYIKYKIEQFRCSSCHS